MGFFLFVLTLYDKALAKTLFYIKIIYFLNILKQLYKIIDWLQMATLSLLLLHKETMHVYRIGYFINHVVISQTFLLAMDLETLLVSTL